MKHKMLALTCVAAMSVYAAPYSFKIECDEPARMRAVGEQTEFRIYCTDLATTNGFGGEVEVKLDNFGTVVFASRKVDPAKENPISLRGSLDKPGFLRAVAINANTTPTRFGLGDGNACASVGYEPEKIRPGFDRPADFDEYWDGERARLRREVPLDARREEMPDALAPKGFRCWKVSFATFGGKRAWGFLTMPKTGSGPWPLRVNVPGAGPAASMRGAQSHDGAVTLVMNVHPYEPANTPAEQNKLYKEQDNRMCKKYGSTYATAGANISREEYFFHDAILGIDRAVDWAVALPEVDRECVLYFGGSQGGGFGMYLMGLNKNFKRGLVWICALADLGGYRVGRIPGWPRLVECNSRARETAERVAPYFDACHFAARIGIPVRMSAGLSDTCCPPPSVWSAYNSLGTADKDIVPCPGIGHGLPKDVRAQLEKWLSGEDGACKDAGCVGEVKVSSFGFDPDDSTEFLQKAFDSGARRVVVDKQGGPWVTRQLFIRRKNVELVFEPGVELLAKKGEFRAIGDSLITAGRSAEGLRIVGNGATLRMYMADYMKKPYERGEWRHALTFVDAKNVTIENLRLVDSGGDAIYLGASPNGACENVTIRGVTTVGNLRQGLSVISAENLLVENCTFETTCGLAPMDGIDFEPNNPGQRLVNCTVRNCTSRANRGFGWDVAIFNLNSSSKPVSILFEGCVEEDNFGSFRTWCENRDFDEVRGFVTVRNCSFAHPKVNTFAFAQNPDFPVKLDFQNCRYVPSAGAPAGDVPDWKSLNIAPVLSGAAVKANAVAKPAFSRAVVYDSKPGEMVELSKFNLRFGCRYLFYADRARTVRFRGRQAHIGNGKVPRSDAPILVKTLTDEEVAKMDMPGFDEGEFSVAVPAAGFYTLYARCQPSPFALTASDAPVAVDCTTARIAIIDSAGRFFFRTAGDGRPFALTAGGGGAEMLKVQLVAPDGSLAWEYDNIDRSFRHVIDNPAEGLWSICIAKPSKGRFEDYKVDLTGIPGHLFLCAEKTWCIPAGKPATK